MTPLLKIRSAAVGLCAAAVMAACATACSSNSAGNSGSNAAGGGTLTIQGDTGNPTLVENFNPFQPTTELHGTYLMYEPLETVSTINGSYTPFLATGYKFTSPTTLVYTIRQGVKWSDGTAFTPADVVFTFDLLKKYPALDTNGIWSQISGVSASGSDVTFTFKAPDVPFAATIAQTPIVPKHIWSAIGNPVTFANTHPVGTGPFTIQLLDAVANPFVASRGGLGVRPPGPAPAAQAAQQTAAQQTAAQHQAARQQAAR